MILCTTLLCEGLVAYTLTIMNSTSQSRNIIIVSMLVAVGVATIGVYVFYGHNNFRTSSALIDDRHVNTKEELAAARKLYRDNFKPGCKLKDPTTLNFPNGLEVTATFAQCSPEYPQKTYKTGKWEGGSAVIEVDEKTKKELAVIIPYHKVDISSSTQVVTWINNAERYYKTYRSKLPVEVTSNDNVTMHTAVVNGYLVIYQTDSVRTNFDETTILVKYNTIK